jgi:hypothetical protein
MNDLLYWWLARISPITEPKTTPNICCLCNKKGTHLTPKGDWYCGFHSPDNAKLNVPMKEVKK